MYLTPLLPPGALLAEMSPDDADPKGLHPEELGQIQRAVAKRRREYAAGRLLAHRLFGELAVAAGPLLNGPDRAPCWPPGLCGSISHSRVRAAAIVARTDHLTSLGCDLELAEPVEPGIWDIVLAPDERGVLERWPEVPPGRVARLCFSAKESVYKALYPLCQELLDFHDVHLELVREGPLGGWFTGQLRRRVGMVEPGTTVSGGWRWTEDEIGTLAAIPARGG